MSSSKPSRSHGSFPNGQFALLFRQSGKRIARGISGLRINQLQTFPVLAFSALRENYSGVDPNHIVVAPSQYSGLNASMNPYFP